VILENDRNIFGVLSLVRVVKAGFNIVAFMITAIQADAVTLTALGKKHRKVAAPKWSKSLLKQPLHNLECVGLRNYRTECFHDGPRTCVMPHMLMIQCSCVNLARNQSCEVNQNMSQFCKARNNEGDQSRDRGAVFHLIPLKRARIFEITPNYRIT
jgi:hypothetical protein